MHRAQIEAIGREVSRELSNVCFDDEGISAAARQLLVDLGADSAHLTEEDVRTYYADLYV